MRTHFLQTKLWNLIISGVLSLKFFTSCICLCKSTRCIIIIYTIVPIPSVAINILNNQMVGQALMLKCDVTTVRGITSRVDIIWSSNGVELNFIEGVNISSVTNDSVLFTNAYVISQLSTADENREYQCQVSIDTESPALTTDVVILNVIGKHIIMYVYICDWSCLINPICTLSSLLIYSYSRSFIA